ncbi:MAG TPA: peroxidase family protein [Xanthomonadales bacterium]|nr:peroxidase family protein [Xanthomonadales bacterium]
MNQRSIRQGWLYIQSVIYEFFNRVSFLREHNRLCSVISNDNPNLDGDEIYQRARKLVGAELQIITYREYLPRLLGRDALRGYGGYQDNVDASIANIFASAAYRFGHSALSPTLLRLNEQGDKFEVGHLQQRDAYFSPSGITDEGGD